MQAILDFFKKFIDIVSTDLRFVIDDISSEDSSAVGVIWHLGTLNSFLMIFLTALDGMQWDFVCSFCIASSH